MNSKLGKGLFSALGLASLLALGACGDRGSESAADRSVRNETASEQAGAGMTSQDAAARAGAQRSASKELAQGNGS
jgi:hypothetical protein